ncbi:GTP cyclohydrolase II [Saprospiraceae bacterium]|nr:GTP cyclohydrolase II [Saprospiraceae bacterium]MDC1508203.1 GTP cyclohydrolase II [Saprospiraceae bacterium]
MNRKISKIKKQAQVTIPTKYGTFRTIAFASDSNEKMPHMALVHPDTDFSKIVNVRIHSECMTGDVFHSYRCECGEQLDWSMQYIQKHTGVIIYLRQEGRGIGIINKLHAYVKQDEGYDTAEANKELGFGYDDRTYEDAITIISDLGIGKVNLLTNNPEKIKAMDNCTIKVMNRIPVEIEPHFENLDYLRTKKYFFGHKLNKLK